MTTAGTPSIESGLAKYEPDYYAILGVPLNADKRLIRKGYLNTAKQLHPDRFIGQPERRETANWLFSKLISHASEILNREKDRVEYREVLRLRAKRLLSLPPSDVWPQSHFVDKLLQATDLEMTYSDTILNLAAHQYTDLDKAITCTEELSKINLAYLLLSNGYKVAAPPASSTPSTPPAQSAAPTTSSFSRPSTTTNLSVRPQTPRPTTSTPASSVRSTASPSPAANASSNVAPKAEPAPTPMSPGQKRFDQAKQMMSRKLYKEAIQFLNIAIGNEPDNADYHYQRGLAYQKTNHPASARKDFQRALRLDPNHEGAASKLKATASKTSTVSSAPDRQATSQVGASRSTAGSSTTEKKGVFGRLFNR